MPPPSELGLQLCCLRSSMGWTVGKGKPWSPGELYLTGHFQVWVWGNSCLLSSPHLWSHWGWVRCVCVVHLLSHVRLFASPWTMAHRASLSFTICPSLLQLMCACISFSTYSVSNKSFWVGALGCCMPNLCPRGVSRSIFWVWLGTRELESWGTCPLRASVLEL